MMPHSKWHLTYSGNSEIDSNLEVSGTMSGYSIEPKKAIKQSEAIGKTSLTEKRNGLLQAMFSVSDSVSFLSSQI